MLLFLSSHALATVSGNDVLSSSSARPWSSRGGLFVLAQLTLLLLCSSTTGMVVTAATAPSPAQQARQWIQRLDRQYGNTPQQQQRQQQQQPRNNYNNNKPSRRRRQQKRGWEPVLLQLKDDILQQIDEGYRYLRTPAVQQWLQRQLGWAVVGLALLWLTGWFLERIYRWYYPRTAASWHRQALKVLQKGTTTSSRGPNNAVMSSPPPPRRRQRLPVWNWFVAGGSSSSSSSSSYYERAAEEYWQRALAVDPSYVPAVLSLAALYVYRQGQPGRGMDVLDHYQQQQQQKTVSGKPIVATTTTTNKPSTTPTNTTTTTTTTAPRPKRTLPGSSSDSSSSSLRRSQQQQQQQQQTADSTSRRIQALRDDARAIRQGHGHMVHTALAEQEYLTWTGFTVATKGQQHRNDDDYKGRFAATTPTAAAKAAAARAPVGSASSLKHKTL